MLKKEIKMVLCVVLSFLLATGVMGFNVKAAAATTYYVSTTGNDSGTGTVDNPWKTIQKAMNTVRAGDSVYVRGGTYNEKITVNTSGNATDGYITLQNYPGETPVLDGSNLTISSGYSSMLWIADKSYIKIIGLEIRNYKTTVKNNLIMGVYVTGASHDVEIRNCKIHDIQNNSPISKRGTMGTRDAHGIAVYGTDPSTPISNLIVDNCEIYDCVLGSSETLVVNGNVDGWQITNNNIHNTDNIGIDVIGWEGKCSNSSFDQARNGLVSGNSVHDICTETAVINGKTQYNPCYTANDHSSDLIYVDGGKNTVIERNKCYNGDFGIEVASEHANKTTSGITVRNNVIYNNHQCGISIGGNEKDSDGSHGDTVNSYFFNNTLCNNDNKNFYNGQICLKRAHDNQIKNNIIYGTADEDNTLMLNAYMSATYTYNNTLDYNIWYSSLGSSAAIFQWRSSNRQKSWSKYKSASAQESHSKFVDPLFANMTSSDFHLLSSSPAINLGTGTSDQYGTTDFDGTPRVLGGIIDAGAFEKQ